MVLPSDECYAYDGGCLDNCPMFNSAEGNLQKVFTKFFINLIKKKKENIDFI
jgi:hypothetical protein